VLVKLKRREAHALWLPDMNRGSSVEKVAIVLGSRSGLFLRTEKRVDTSFTVLPSECCKAFFPLSFGTFFSINPRLPKLIGRDR
jgi:hypothetical protein